MPKLTWTARTAHVVAQLLRARIEAGAYPPGAVLPPVTEMATTLGVCRRAVASAVRELLGTYLETRPYHGHYVRPRKHWRAP
jgi:DNA-binding FadR family transcriptional regulator